jgi:ribose transport system substrate-binding protein
MKIPMNDPSRSDRRAGPHRRAIALAIAALFALVLAAGCDRGGNGSAAPAAKIVKLAFVTNNASEFWKIAAAGVHKYEQESKVQVDIKMPPNGTTEEQNQILENLASQGYDAIAVSAIAPNDQVPVLNKVAAKAKLITFDSDAPKSNRLLYIGTNNYEAGKVLGNEIVRLLPSGGKMAVFVGTLSADNAQQRLKGIQDAIQGHKIEIVDKREDNTDRACGPTTAPRSPRRSRPSARRARSSPRSSTRKTAR